MENKLSIKRKRVMIYFIEAAERLIKSEGQEGLTIRKVAAEAGYNSATIYNYFEDIDHLLMFASMSYLREYSKDLSMRLDKKMTALVQYRTIYETFTDHCFMEPAIFYNLFFGKYSGRLGEVLNQYYELFPAELERHEEVVKKMLLEGDIHRRDEAVTERLVREGFIMEEKREATVEILVRTHQSFLDDICRKKDKLDLKKEKEEFLKIFDYLLEAARPHNVTVNI